MNRCHSHQRRGHHPTLALGHTYRTLLLFFLGQFHLYRVRTFLNPHVCIPTTSHQLVGCLHSHEYQAKSLRSFHMCSRLKSYAVLHSGSHWSFALNPDAAGCSQNKVIQPPYLSHLHRGRCSFYMPQPSKTTNVTKLVDRMDY